MSQFLKDKLDTLDEEGIISKEMPIFVTNNLKSSFSIRPYQIDGFSRLFYYITSYSKKIKPAHLLFNMATGSGKTYMMAGSILYLYSLGYRKFLFFVNSKNIIAKTRENFLANDSSKYLFANKILFSGKEIFLQEVENFSRNDGEDIEIKFTTIQALHTDMNDVRENRVSYEEFEGQKIVMISDEAHHINSLTKKKLDKDEQEEKKSWEGTVTKIRDMNRENILLEYTATIDDKNSAIVEKYSDKLIYKYDLKAFRADGWSKELDIIKSDLTQDERVLQTLAISQYRLKIAEKYRIRCKPVILFKATSKIGESEENEKKFHDLIENLSPDQFESLRIKTEVDIAKIALEYLKNSIGYAGLIRELREDFKKENCLNVNEDSLDKKSLKKDEINQILSQSNILNSLEDKNNPIRAIFAVQKLNEGWDVLNLFDIVRMYDTRDGDEKNGVYSPGKGTISEAQLIGRGARYFPFSYESYIGEDRHKRKFDKVEHELKILETFYYHTFYNVRYISEIKQALKSIGMIDEDTKPFTLRLKDSFKETELYKEGVVYMNERRERSRAENDNLEQIGIRTHEIEYIIATGRGGDDKVFEEDTRGAIDLSSNLKRVTLKISEIDIRLIKKALARNSFYTFENLKEHIGKLESIGEFISGESYLGSCSIQYASTEDTLKRLLEGKIPDEMLRGVSKLLTTLETEISMREIAYEATPFIPKSIQTVFEEKTIQIPIAKETKSVSGEWFAFEAISGTPEEEGLIECIERMLDELKGKYEEVYLIRNERHFPIYSFKGGERFEPDFVLFLQEKNKSTQKTYQIFIEPKGDGYKATDKWKEDFLLEIETKAEILDMNFGHYRLLGLPFYSVSEEQDFLSKTKVKLL